MTEKLIPFGRGDPRVLSLTPVDEQLLAGEPQPLRILVPADTTRPSSDSLMSCPCGRGDYLYCLRYPYRSCSWHGDDAGPEKAAAAEWWKIFTAVALWAYGAEHAAAVLEGR